MTELPVSELAALCRDRPGAALLDVREPWETALAPLEVAGARTLRIPMQQVPARLAELADGAGPLVCVCHHGVRSRHVAAWLEARGVEDVHNLAGGVDAWSREVDASVPRY